MEAIMRRDAAEAQQGVRREVGVEIELDDGTENAVTRGPSAVAPHYPKAQR